MFAGTAATLEVTKSEPSDHKEVWIETNGGAKVIGVMLRHIKYKDAERKLGVRAREVAMDGDLLYHGTRYARSILKAGTLLRGPAQKTCLAFSDGPAGCQSDVAIPRRLAHPSDFENPA